jgi:hypothetical protein
MALKPETADELRGMVRDLLREVLANRKPSTGAVETVRIANDGDLAAFVARVIQASTLDAVRSGKLRFALQGGTAPAAASAVAGGALEGVITERKLDKIARTGTLVLGPGSVLTPLARDKARRLGLKIERRR